MPAVETTRNFKGFSVGEKPETGLLAGMSYPGFLTWIEEFDAQFGLAYRLHWDVYVFNRLRSEWTRTEITELASPNYSLQAKFMQRLSAINGGSLTEDDDLSQIKLHGWGYCYLVQDDKNPQYLKIQNVTYIPRGVEIPSTVHYEFPEGPNGRAVRVLQKSLTDEPPF